MRLVTNFLIMSGARVLMLICSALLTILTARTLGPNGRGIYALPMLSVSLASSLALGHATAASFFLLNQRAGRTIARAILVALAAFLVPASITTIATAWLMHHLWAAIPALAYAPLYAAYSLTSGYFVGRDRVRLAAVTNLAFYAVTLPLMFVALRFIAPSPYVAVGAWVCGAGVVGISGLALVLRDAHTLDGESVSTKKFIGFATKAGSLGAVNLLNYRVDTYIVAILTSLSTLGLYAVAIAVAESALSLTIAIIQVTAPRIGSLNRIDAAIFAARCARNNLFLSTVICGSIAVVAPIAIRLMFGTAYMSLVPSLRILLIGVVAMSATSVIANYFMLNLGRTSVPIGTALLSASLCAGISLALVPRIGMLGAAIGSTAAYVLSQFAAVALFCKESGLPVSQVLFIDRGDLAVYRQLAARLTVRRPAPRPS